VDTTQQWVPIRVSTKSYDHQLGKKWCTHVTSIHLVQDPRYSIRGPTMSGRVGSQSKEAKSEGSSHGEDNKSHKQSRISSSSSSQKKACCGTGVGAVAEEGDRRPTVGSSVSGVWVKSCT